MSTTGKATSVADKYLCVACRKEVAKTKNDRYRSHSDGTGEPCEMSSAEIPEHVLFEGPSARDADPTVPREGVDFATCPQCDRKVKLTRMGYFEPHDETLRGGDRCPVSGVRAKHARRTEDKLLPGDEPASAEPKVTAQEEITSPAPTSTSAGAGDTPTEPPPSSGGIDWSKVGGLKHLGEMKKRLEGLPEGSMIAQGELIYSGPESARPADSSASTETSSPESATTSKPSPSGATLTGSTSSDVPESAEEPASAGPFHLAPLLDERVLQPFSHISQPFPVPIRVRLAESMTDEGKERAARFKEIFFSYNNRRSSDNRSAQTTLGPSEIGYECDRRLAMSLMGVPPVNPGGDGWAAWLGTQGHRGLDEVFTWASANSGRFATEVRLEFPSRLVPKGTTDIIDREVGEIGDFKFLGDYSLKKLIQEGPPPHYRVQAHVYGLGAALAGEKIRRVAIYGLPRAASSLSGMYVWTEKFDRKLAEGALARVDRIAENASAIRATTPATPMEAAREFGTADECRYCPFHQKGDKEMKRGCPGK